jgi:hypothetical protein
MFIKLSYMLGCYILPSRYRSNAIDLMICNWAATSQPNYSKTYLRILAQKVNIAAEVNWKHSQ